MWVFILSIFQNKLCPDLLTAHTSLFMDSPVPKGSLLFWGWEFKWEIESELSVPNECVFGWKSQGGVTDNLACNKSWSSPLAGFGHTYSVFMVCSRSFNQGCYTAHTYAHHLWSQWMKVMLQVWCCSYSWTCEHKMGNLTWVMEVRNSLLFVFSRCGWKDTRGNPRLPACTARGERRSKSEAAAAAADPE